MVASILNHASEIWGFEEWSKLETLDLKACKYALGVRSSTTTDAVRGVNSILTLGGGVRDFCLAKLETALRKMRYVT